MHTWNCKVERKIVMFFQKKYWILNVLRSSHCQLHRYNTFFHALYYWNRNVESLNLRIEIVNNSMHSMLNVYIYEHWLLKKKCSCHKIHYSNNEDLNFEDQINLTKYNTVIDFNSRSDINLKLIKKNMKNVIHIYFVGRIIRVKFNV